MGIVVTDYDYDYDGVTAERFLCTLLANSA